MTETEAGRSTGAHGLPPRGPGKPAHAADDSERRLNGTATALAEPSPVSMDSTTIIPRIPANGEPPEPVGAAVPAPAATAPGQRTGRRSPEPTEAPAAATGERPARLRGTTAVADDVVEKVAGFAAEQVDGVFDLGGDVARALTSIRERIGIGEGTSRRGIHVELSGRAARLTLTLVVQFGHPAMQVAEQVRENVIAAVETMLDMDVVECNVIIDDIHVGD